MVKHTQTICRLLPTNCLSVFDYFVRLALKGLIGVINIFGKLSDELVITNVLVLLESQVLGDSRRCNFKFLHFKKIFFKKNVMVA